LVLTAHQPPSMHALLVQKDSGKFIVLP